MKLLAFAEGSPDAAPGPVCRVPRRGIEGVGVLESQGFDEQPRSANHPGTDVIAGPAAGMAG